MGKLTLYNFTAFLLSFE